MNQDRRFVMVFIETTKRFNAKLGLTIRHSQRRTRLFVHECPQLSPLQAARVACDREGHVLVDVYPLGQTALA